ncbi:MAG TPA: dihydroxyacetone kinase subunit DhaL [Thermomicrobiales bacterium]|nr:dihydroxyacetone kinase subunit DhaL [Thermomicrobiales bacterium]
MFNDPIAFKEEMLDGFTAAYGRYLRRVPDTSGVVAVNAPVPGRVALVIGGGSGHYPAFCGLVGDGMATGAVVGDIFSSPSAEQMYRVAKAAEGGGGVLFGVVNYSGDVMNFGIAQQRLQAEGIDARSVLITDDVLSAPPEEAEKRRGIAGGFYVYKTGGASAARGDDIDAVEALMRHANARVRTAGVAFEGCTIPGQKDPLFTVAPGAMEVGLGIHGEPGVRSIERLPASEVAKLLVDTVLAEAPAAAGSRAAVLVNGLGATKYEELFVLYHSIAPLLANAGIEPYEPLVGEFVTSLNMAGCSLTLFWLDDELQSLHDATAATPAFTRIGPDIAVAIAPRKLDSDMVGDGLISTAGAAEDESGMAGQAGRLVRAGLAAALQAMETHEEELGRLDAAAGDGDHGAAMVRGFRAATAAVTGSDATARETLIRAGRTFADAAGGASGALVGDWLAAMGRTLPRDDEEVDGIAINKALQAGLASMQRLGHAEPGDKTMVDTLEPFVHTFEGAIISGHSLAEAWSAGLDAGKAGMERTTGMVSKRGRSSRLGERSRGIQDAGATSMYYVLEAFGSLWS